MSKILGISAFYHDAAAALVVGGRVVAAAQEERFTRVKHTAEFPVQAIRYCLEFTGVTIDELDAIVFYDKPLLKFERLLETYYAFAPRGVVSFVRSIPVWLHDKLFLKKLIYEGLREVGNYDKKKARLLFTEHHLAHAASAFYPSPYTDAAILTIDGVGEWNTATIGLGTGSEIKMLREMNFPHSVGLLYSAFTYFLGFTVNSGEYKLMGLAPYGNPDAAQTAEFEQIIKQHLVIINEDGSVWLNQAYFGYATGLRMANDKKWTRLFGFGRRDAEGAIAQHHCNLALAIQRVTEDIVLKMAVEAKRITGCENLCMAGGVALNCVANGKLLRSGIFRNIFIQPAAGDAGGALGAALAVSSMYFDEPRQVDAGKDGMQGTYLGPGYSFTDIEQMCRDVNAVYKTYDAYSRLTAAVAKHLADGKVVGWFQGRMEFGPRALGNRSILADARNPAMQQQLNLKIKYREGFRPFAPSVMAEDARAYFDLDVASPYMLLVAQVKDGHRLPLPPGYNDMALQERLQCPRSDIQPVTHVDGSARIHTVEKEVNPRFWHLINTFKELTGYGLVVNTSFNVRGEPVVCTPYDAYRCFMATDMDYLVINDYIFAKTEQPNWQNKDRWQVKYEAD